jgi:hypothetical protein
VTQFPSFAFSKGRLDMLITQDFVTLQLYSSQGTVQDICAQRVPQADRKHVILCLMAGVLWAILPIFDPSTRTLGYGFVVVLFLIGLNVQRRTQTIFVDDEQQVTSTLMVAEDSRRVVLTEPINQWDRTIRDVLARSGQTFDGLPIVDWLGSAASREARKACLLNLMAKLRTLPQGDAVPFLNLGG